MGNAMKKETAPPPVFDAAMLAAAGEALERQKYLADVKAHDRIGPEDEGSYRFNGTTPRRLDYELKRWQSDLSRTPIPPTNTEDFMHAGAVMEFHVGDIRPPAEFFEKLDENEAAESTSVQQALRYRAAARPVAAAEATFAEAEAGVTAATAEVARANKKREAASDVRDVCLRAVERERARLGEFLAPFGDGGEDKFRSILSSMKPPAKEREVGGARIMRDGEFVVLPVAS